MAFAVFGRGLFLEPLAELLPAVDLARFSSPAHGILDLFLDGRRIGTVDWFADYTRERSRSIVIDVRWTGVHQLVGRCCGSNADEVRPTRHWMCLSGLHLRRIAGT